MMSGTKRIPHHHPRAASPSSAVSSDILDAHFGRVRQYYEGRIAQLERELVLERQRNVELQRRMGEEMCGSSERLEDQSWLRSSTRQPSEQLTTDGRPPVWRQTSPQRQKINESSKSHTLSDNMFAQGRESPRAAQLQKGDDSKQSSFFDMESANFFRSTLSEVRNSMIPARR